MQYTWRDLFATLLALLGAVVVFAKLESYTWWLIGSWKGALGVVTVIGLGILALYFIDLVEFATVAVAAEVALWITAATVIIASLTTKTTKAEFIWSAALVGMSWLTPFVLHFLGSASNRGSHYAPVH